LAPSTICHEEHLFLATLGSGLGCRTLGILGAGSTDLVGLDDALDDTDSDSLTHVTDGKATKRRVLREGLDAHRLLRNHLDDGGITRLDGLGEVLNLLAGTTIDLLLDLVELAGNVGCVAVEHWCVAVGDLTRVVQDDDLGEEGLGGLGWVVLGVSSDVATADILDGNVLDVEADVVTGDGLLELLVVHLNGLDLSCDVDRGEGDDHARLQDTSLNTTDGHRADTANLVDILKRKAEGLGGGALRGDNGVKGLKKSLALGITTLLAGDFPTLVPGELVRSLNHVVSVPARNGDESNSLGVVTDLLDVGGDLSLDLIEASLAVWGLSGVDLVDTDNELLHTEGEGKKSVLTGLAVGGDTSLELSSTGGDDEDGAVSLRGTGDHVLDEVTVTRGINDGDVELGGLKLPESDIDGDTTLTLSLELVQDPGVLEGALALSAASFSNFSIVRLSIPPHL